MKAHPLKVTYISGYGRSGSTLLSRMLGQLPGHMSCGELQKLWIYGLRDDYLCTCGNRFSECPFWSAVIAKAFGSGTAVELEAVLRQKRTTRLRNLLRMVFPCLRSRSYAKRIAAYSHTWMHVLEAIRDVSAAEVIVDSSKVPHLLLFLQQIEGIDLRVVHLVRDSRAVAHSYSRKKRSLEKAGPSRYIEQQGPLRVSLRWMGWNALIDAFRRQGGNVVRVRYEDLVHDPEEELRRLLDSSEAETGSFEFISQECVSLEAGHMLAGNPVRFQRGAVPLYFDDEWRRMLPRWKRTLVTLFTFPLLRKYGYGRSNA